MRRNIGPAAAGPAGPAATALTTDTVPYLQSADTSLLVLVDLFKIMELLNNRNAFYMLGRGSPSPDRTPIG